MTGDAKTKGQSKRVVCQCRTAKCFMGTYTDSNGVSRPGVELAHKTATSHARVDRMMAARGSLEPSSTSTRQHPHNTMAADSPSNLISQFSSINIQASTSSVNHPPDHLPTYKSSGSSSSNSSKLNGSPPPSELAISKYDCGMSMYLLDDSASKLIFFPHTNFKLVSTNLA